MFFSTLILALLPILLAPVWMVRITLEAKQLETRQVKLDNALILLGRQDRELFNYAVKINQFLKGLHQNHHRYHHCARIPASAAQCIPWDQFFENAIRMTSFQAERFMKMEWKRNGISLEVKTHQISPQSENRRSAFPFYVSSCPLCHFPEQFKLVPSANRWGSSSQIQSNPKVEGSISLIGRDLQHANWNYQLQ